MMQFFLTIAVAALLMQEGVAPAHDAALDEAVQWLDKLEAKGKEVRTFCADVRYEKIDEFLGDKQLRVGRVVYASGVDAKLTRFAVLFEKHVIDGKMSERRLEYIFDGRWLVEKNHDERLFIKRQVVAPGEEGNLDPLSIDGPFPLPIGQKRAVVLARFDVEVVKPDEETDPKDAATVHLRLTPKEGAPVTRDRKNFDRVDFWFDKETLLPLQVETREEGRTTRVKLSNVIINQSSDEEIDKLISVEPPGDGWHVEVKPWEE